MNVFITLDYEIFFGEQQGSVDNTLIYPTNLLLKVSESTGVKFTFFIDVGFLIKLEQYSKKFNNLEEDHLKVCRQIKSITDSGHDCQLHIHPHWENSTYDGKNWIFDYEHYKLADFSIGEINSIFFRYKKYLVDLTKKEVHSFRAGGWCVQPFEKIEEAFKINGIKIDSSVYLNGKNIDGAYNYDFTKTPNKSFWKFSNNECIEDIEGDYSELVISNYTYSPWFFWSLFILGNLFPKKHKPIGKGKPMKSSVTRKKMLTQFHLQCASIDGYYASKMNTVLKKNRKINFENTVFIGHPKAFTYFSIETVSEFIRKNKDKVTFKTFTNLVDEVY